MNNQQHVTIADSSNPRIAAIVEMLAEVSRQTDPNGAVRAFARRINELKPRDGILSVSRRDMPEGKYRITRQFGFDGFQQTHTEGTNVENPWEQWAQLREFSGGFVGGALTDNVPKLLQNLDVRNDPVLGDLIGDMGCCVVVPIFDGGEALNWLFNFRRDPTGYGVEDLEEFLMTGNLFGSMTRNLVSVKRAAELNEALHKQFEEVARVQQSLLPDRNPDIPGVTIATSYLTSQQAGGDYYDFFEMPNGKWGILIADVSGHGAGAATIMAMLHGILHSYECMCSGPSYVLQHANKRLMAAGMEASFVTAIFAMLDPAERTLTYACAGHPRPRLKDTRTGTVEVLDEAAGLPLGVIDDADFPETVRQLEKGHTVVMYTDGITEEFNDVRDMFGTDRLDEALHHCSGQPGCVVDSVHADLYKHTGRLNRNDDQTLVIVHFDNDEPTA